MQVRGLEHVSWLSLVGTLGMLTALGVACIKLLMMAPPPEQGRHASAVGSDPPSDPELQHGFYAVLVALMDIVFAFGGQQNWVRPGFTLQAAECHIIQQVDQALTLQTRSCE